MPDEGFIAATTPRVPAGTCWAAEAEGRNSVPMVVATTAVAATLADVRSSVLKENSDLVQCDGRGGARTWTCRSDSTCGSSRTSRRLLIDGERGGGSLACIPHHQLEAGNAEVVDRASAAPGQGLHLVQ